MVSHINQSYFQGSNFFSNLKGLASINGHAIKSR